MSLDAVQTVHLGAAGGGEALVDTLRSSTASNAPMAIDSQPADLQAFLGRATVAEACEALALSRGTVHRLKQGYWPGDSRKIVQAWGEYKGRSVKRATSWFIRRVSEDGVCHGGKLFGSSQLAGRAGELLALARVADGDLLAQTLELPTERFTLSVKA